MVAEQPASRASYPIRQGASSRAPSAGTLWRAAARHARHWTPTKPTGRAAGNSTLAGVRPRRRTLSSHRPGAHPQKGLNRLITLISTGWAPGIRRSPASGPSPTHRSDRIPRRQQISTSRDQLRLLGRMGGWSRCGPQYCSRGRHYTRAVRGIVASLRRTLAIQHQRNVARGRAALNRLLPYRDALRVASSQTATCAGWISTESLDGDYRRCWSSRDLHAVAGAPSGPTPLCAHLQKPAAQGR